MQEDLDEVKRQHQETARTALHSEPSYSRLILGVKHWAKAVGRVCRKHSRDCAKLFAEEPDSAIVTIKTLLVVLCDHLGLAPNPLLLIRPEAEDWPENNGVSEFVLEVSGAPIELVDGRIITRAVLARWEPKSRFGRLIAGLEAEASDEKFLSLGETRKHLRALEESFRDMLFEYLRSWSSEAVLETYQSLPASQAHKSIPRFNSILTPPVAPALISASSDVEKSSAAGNRSELRLATTVARKLENPAGNPTMSVKEAGHALGKSASSIYRYVAEGKLSWQSSRGKLSTRAVMRQLETPLQ